MGPGIRGGRVNRWEQPIIRVSLVLGKLVVRTSGPLGQSSVYFHWHFLEGLSFERTAY
jgi:hypothetical protein